MKRAFVLTVVLILTVCLMLTGCKGFADNASSDIAVNTETDFEIAQSTEDVISDTSNNQGDGQIIKEDTTDVSAKADTADEKGENYPDKTVKINGKNVKLKYVSSKKAEGAQKHDRNVYSSQDGMTVEFDAEIGCLVSYLTGVHGSPEKPTITESDAVMVAEKAIKEQCDISLFQFEKVAYSESFGYIVEYCRHVAGYKTLENINVTVSPDGKVMGFFFNPLFNGVDISKISVDISKVNEKLDNLIYEKFCTSKVEYTVSDMRLLINRDDKFEMYAYTSVKVTNNSGNVKSYSICYKLPID